MNEFSFPNGFLWGTATSGHQVEGNNTNTESWVLEHLPGAPYVEPSGDAIDHYHRYPQDIALMAELGFNAYRFSIEWARIEPAEGEFSFAELEHYRRMLAACHEHGLKPVVTFNHFISPRWLMSEGGWLDEKTPERFARFCDRANRHLGDLISVACTMNEPNLSEVIANMMPFRMQDQPWWKLAAQTFGVAPDRLGLFQFMTGPEMRENLFNAHHRAVEVLRSGPGDYPVGLTLALIDIQAAEGGEEKAAALRYKLSEVYLEQLVQDDFVGVQNYERFVIGPDGLIPPGEDAEKNQSGQEFYPEALGGAIRHAAAVTGIPMIMTENGISTTADSQRIRYLQRAIQSMADVMAEGLDVRGYLCWSAFDNFEWVSGYGPKMGLIAVDRETMERKPKPSAYWLGAFARNNRLPVD